MAIRPIVAPLSLLAAAGLAAPASAGTPVPQVVEVDLSGMTSMDGEGAALNEVVEVDLAALGLDVVVAVGWDVVLSTEGPSWASDVTLGLGDAGTASEVFLTPGLGTDEPVTGGSFFTDVNGDDLFDVADDLVDLGAVGLDPIAVPSGTLRIEIFEVFDDQPGMADAEFGTGSTLYLQAIPGPGGLALIGLAGLAGTRRRR